MRKIADFVYVRVEPTQKVEATKTLVDLQVKAVPAVKGKIDAAIGQSNQVLR